jgi:hypothetical protein
MKLKGDLDQLKVRFIYKNYKKTFLITLTELIYAALNYNHPNYLSFTMESIRIGLQFQSKLLLTGIFFLLFRR